ncbi:3'-5' exonuclease [Permianibacter sp. IMCC34836]|uniref:3'-5' exonuclease n=1 Tax=Permianibacter fluminis TaxID=2738515 RepID=UPI001558062E|nr:3'-5' exonuclease [Permianibacter fluminis]NQD37065.1 3'-5' exonuclease [Permianibacter fluminis]
MNILVFDIETVPDIAGLRRLYELGELPDDDVLAAAQLLRRQKTGGSDFLPLHLQRVVAISVVLRSQDRLAVWSIGTEDSNEAELIQRFYDGLEKYTPTLVSWNGGGFDLPVLHYRAMLHNVVASRYWETGETDSAFRWNNYLNRYHDRHTDLMDVLAMYQGRAVAPLDDVATLLGYPGKMGMSGAKVWDAFKAGQLKAIRDYCETDVLNTYLVYLRYEQMRGRLDPNQLHTEQQKLRAYLAQEQKTHFDEFLAAWPS